MEALLQTVPQMPNLPLCLNNSHQHRKKRAISSSGVEEELCVRSWRVTSLSHTSAASRCIMNYRLLILPSSHDLHAHLNLCCAGISSRPVARLLHPPTFPTPSWLFKSEPPTSGLAATERRCRQKQVQDLASLRPRQKLFKTQRSEL